MIFHTLICEHEIPVVLAVRSVAKQNFTVIVTRKVTDLCLNDRDLFNQCVPSSLLRAATLGRQCEKIV